MTLFLPQYRLRISEQRRQNFTLQMIIRQSLISCVVNILCFYKKVFDHILHLHLPNEYVEMFKQNKTFNAGKYVFRIGISLNETYRAAS